MWTFLLPLLLHAVENAPMILEDVEKIFAELGAQDGGVAKLASAASVFATLAERASAHRSQLLLTPTVTAEPTRAVDANGQPISDTQAEMQQAN